MRITIVPSSFSQLLHCCPLLNMKYRFLPAFSPHHIVLCNRSLREPLLQKLIPAISSLLLLITSYWIKCNNKLSDISGISGILLVAWRGKEIPVATLLPQGEPALV